MATQSKWRWIFAAALATASVTAISGELGRQTLAPHEMSPGDAPPPILRETPPVPSGKVKMDSAEEHDLRLHVLTKELKQPWSLAFMPDGSILITERGGQIRVVRDGKLVAAPVAGVPEVHTGGPRGLEGLMDVALHPRFSENKWIYFAYHRPYGDDGETVLARGTWDGSALTDVRTIFESGAVDTEASRIAFGPGEMIYMSISAPGSEKENRAQDLNDYAGKAVRLRDDGSIPEDNPYVGRANAKPGIFTVGHRNGGGLAMNPATGEMWETEQGPNGGDELNILRSGRNYGWPIVSFGRDYFGTPISKQKSQPGMEDPVVVWLPSIAITGMTFYTGDRFPHWKGNLFVGGLREGGIPGTGQIQRIVFNDKWQELRREPMLMELKQRIRDIRQGPDGLLYVLTAEDEGALIRIEPK